VHDASQDKRATGGITVSALPNRYSINLVSPNEHISLATAFARTIGLGQDGSPTYLGSFGAGAYQSTASGLVDLVGDTDFQQFPIKPDGVRGLGGVTYPNYSHSRQSQWGHDDNGNYGPGGTAIKLGALMGKVNYGAWFLIVQKAKVVFSSRGNLSAQVNSTYYANNAGPFGATVSYVPDTGSIAAFFGAGVVVLAVARRRLG